MRLWIGTTCAIAIMVGLIGSGLAEPARAGEPLLAPPVSESPAPIAPAPRNGALKAGGQAVQALGLTPQQRAQFKEVFENFKAVRISIRGDSTLTGPRRRFALRNLLAQERAALQNILTPDQLTRLDQIRAANRVRQQGIAAKGTAAPANE